MILANENTITLNIAICDDNKEYVRFIRQKSEAALEKAQIEYSIIEFASPAQMLEYSAKAAVDIVLSDIEMPGMDGFEMKERLYEVCPDAYVIFVTAHEELAYQSYKLRPYWFVAKRDIDKIDTVLVELAQKILIIRKADVLLNLSNNSTITININTTVYITTYKNYIVIHDKSGNNKTSLRATIKDTYQALKGQGFILIKNGYIVNCRFIKKFTYSYVMLEDGTTISVTRDRAKLKEALDIYSKFKRDIII